MALANSCLWIRVTKNEGQMTRKALESAGIYDKTRKVKSDNSDLEIPIIDTHNLESILDGVVEEYSISSSDFVHVPKSTLANELFKSAKNVNTAAVYLIRIYEPIFKYLTFFPNISGPPNN